MNSQRALAVFAHPDDEAFRCGGTLALLAQRGVTVTVITFTRGQAGSCGKPPICKPEELGAVRAKELICSCRALGIEDPLILNYEDGCLSEVSHKEGTARINTYIQSLQPQVIITWPSDGLSGHPDHIAVSEWTSEAYTLAKNIGNETLAGLYHLAVPRSIADELGLKKLHSRPDSEITVMVDVQDVWAQKTAAIQCHRTQAGESPILNAPYPRQKLFLGKEHFIRASGTQQDDMVVELYRTQKELRQS